MEGDSKKDSFTEKEKQAKVVRRIVLITLSVLVALLAAIGIGGYLYISSALDPVDEETEETMIIEIPIGSNAATIGEKLEKEGVINNGKVFQYYVRYKNETGLQAGEYELSPSMDTDEIIQELKNGVLKEEYEVSFTIPEGTWYEDIIATISEETPYEVSEIEAVLEDEEYLQELIDRYSILTEDILDDDIRYPLEGYLFPAKYDLLEKEVEITTIIERMIERMQENMVKFSEQVEQMKYSTHELLTLASIVEREARKQEDRPRIAGVLYNRLDAGRRLEVDPTVSYANGEHTYMTTNEDLESESAYNTYRYEGFPPGPIASPGLPSIKAVLNPEKSDYFYFYARRNGEVIYNENYESHLETQEKYRSEWLEAEEE